MIGECYIIPMLHALQVRTKLYLMLLPLVLVIILVSGILSSFESRAALTRVVNRHMAYKAEQLRNYMYSEWEALEELELADQPAYQRAMEESFRSYAVSLLKSKTESIIIFNSKGDLVMRIGLKDYTLDNSEVFADSPSNEALNINLDPGWFRDELLGESRVGVAYEFTPFDWTVTVTELQSSFFTDIQKIRNMHIAILIVASLVLIVLISVSIGHVIRPVERLTAAIVHITDTMDLSKRVDVEFADEIGRLAHRFNNMITSLQGNYKQLQKTSEAEKKARKMAVDRESETLFILGRVSDYRDEDTGEHLKRIGSLSELLSRLLGQTKEQQNLIRYSAPLHDIGKIGIPDSILLKPGRLTEEEFSQMKQHTVLGYELLKHSNSSYLKEGAHIALTHHEKWNGTGYPNRLSGENIPITGRIVSIVDVFDALTSKRPYKEAWTYQRALDLILEERGKHFDPQLVDLFAKYFSDFTALL